MGEFANAAAAARRWIAELGWLPLVDHDGLDEFRSPQEEYDLDTLPSDPNIDEGELSHAIVPEHDPLDPAERYVALNVLWHAFAFGAINESPESAALRVRRLRSFLTTLVEAFPADACESTVQVQWEMILAAELGLWDRLETLYRTWKRIAPEDTLAAACALARIKILPSLVHIDQPGAGLHWWLEYPCDLSGVAHSGTELLFQLAINVGGPPSNRLECRWAPWPEGQDVQRLYEASDLLRRAEADGHLLDPVATSMAAWCDTVIGVDTGSVERLRRAAKRYETLLSSMSVARDAWGPTNQRLLILSLVRVNAAGGDLSSALEWAERLNLENKEEPYFWELLAQLRRRSGDETGWVEAYEEYVRRSPHVDRDWQVTELLRLALAQRDHFRIAELLASSSALQDDLGVARGIVELEWKSFGSLGENARVKWLLGLAFLSNPRIAGPLGENRWALAIAHIGEATRLFLYDAAIAPFSQWLAQEGHMERLSREAERGSNDATSLSVLRRGTVTLGQITALLDHAASNRGTVGKRLAEWLNSNRRSLSNCLAKKGLIEALRTVTTDRNEAVHENRKATADDAKSIYRTARDIVDRASQG